MFYGRTIFTWFVLASITFAASANTSFAQETIRGTIVVAVPASEGLLVCADKRLYNDQSRTYTDDNIKIRKVSSSALFVATHTIGFYDARSRTMAFNAFDVAEKYVATHDLSEGKAFFDGLRKEINARLRDYFSKRKVSEWPDSDRAANNLLFNLIFYTTVDGRAFSHTVRVFYEKSKTPVVYIPDPVREEIKNTKLAGKGREVISYLATAPHVANDSLIQRYGSSAFESKNATTIEATSFARKLIRLTSTGVADANVSPASDCALLHYQTGFRWIN